MLRVFTLLSIGLFFLTGCITVNECAGDHKETYNNISPTTNGDTETKPDQNMKNGS